MLKKIIKTQTKQTKKKREKPPQNPVNLKQKKQKKTPKPNHKTKQWTCAANNFLVTLYSFSAS